MFHCTFLKYSLVIIASFVNLCAMQQGCYFVPCGTMVPMQVMYQQPCVPCPYYAVNAWPSCQEREFVTQQGFLSCPKNASHTITQMYSHAHDLLVSLLKNRYAGPLFIHETMERLEDTVNLFVALSCPLDEAEEEALSRCIHALKNRLFFLEAHKECTDEEKNIFTTFKVSLDRALKALLSDSQPKKDIESWIASLPIRKEEKEVPARGWSPLTTPPIVEQEVVNQIRSKSSSRLCSRVGTPVEQMITNESSTHLVRTASLGVLLQQSPRKGKGYSMWSFQQSQESGQQ